MHKMATYIMYNVFLLLRVPFLGKIRLYSSVPIKVTWRNCPSVQRMTKLVVGREWDMPIYPFLCLG